MDFADKIKFLREKILDMTQVELAKKIMCKQNKCS